MNISTHSLTRRLTTVGKCSSLQRSYFNSQPHKEADLSVIWISTSIKYFNSQPHKEADEIDFLLILLDDISTHSLTRRLTNVDAQDHSCMCYFNSQPHKEADGMNTTNDN